VSIRSEPNGPRIEAGYPYTGDGFRAENCSIIEAGVLRNFTLGLYGSNKTGKPRCPSGGGAIVVEPGETPLDGMIKDVRHGILLARFSGGSPSDNGDFSGVAKNSYLIENGKIVRPVGETMLAGNVAALFSSVRAVSKESADYGSAILPWVLAGGVTISGK
jgi:PmbA protein